MRRVKKFHPPARCFDNKIFLFSSSILPFQNTSPPTRSSRNIRSISYYDSNRDGCGYRPHAGQVTIITNATSWASLPLEIRQMMLSLVGLPILGRRYKVAQFTTVCQEWQAFFEVHLFRRLALDSESLGDFDEIFKRYDIRLAYIQKLWLRIKLRTYGCPDCDRPESVAM